MSFTFFKKKKKTKISAPSFFIKAHAPLVFFKRLAEQA